MSGNRLIFLLMLCAVFAFSAQGQFSISPFEDYAKCKTGFLRGKRDTLYPAKFENLSVVQFPNYYGGYPDNVRKGWILSDNNKFGCLKENGKWLIPCEYDDITFNELSSQFIVKRNGKYGMISSRKDSIILPIEYDRIFPELSNNVYYGAMYIQKGNLLGIYDLRGKITIEPQYERLERIYRRGENYDNSVSYYLAKQKGKMGLISETGKVLIPIIYEELELFEDELAAEQNVLFRVWDEQDRQALFDQTGKQLIPFNRTRTEPAHTYRVVREQRCVDYIYELDSLDRTRVVSLTTGKASDWYPEMTFLWDHILGFSEDQWTVLDTNFQVVYSNVRETDKLAYFDFENQLRLAVYFPSMDSREELSSYVDQLNRSFKTTSYAPVYLIQRVVPLTPKEQKRSDISERQTYGLINLQNGTRVAPIYSSFHRIFSIRQLYYWGVRNSALTEEDDYTVDVFDSLGVFLKTICLDRFEYKKMTEYEYHGYYDTYLKAQNDSHQYGGRLLNGTRVTPYVLDNEPFLFSVTNDSVGVFIFSEPSEKSDYGYKNYFTDFHGNELLSGRRFEPEQGQPSEDYGLPTDPIIELMTVVPDPVIKNARFKLATIVNRKLEILLDSCQTFTANCPGIKLGQPYYHLAIKNDFVYIRVDSRYHLLDSTYFLQPTGKNVVSERLCVDPSGKRIPEEKKIEPPKEVIPKLNAQRYGNCYVVLENEVLKVEDLKHKLIQTIPNVRSFYEQNGKLFVYMKDTTQGMLNTQTGQWLIKPIYNSVQVYYEDGKGTFWANNGGKWFIINERAEPLTQPIFDQIVPTNHGRSWFLFSSYSKTGVMNRNYQVIVEPTYTKHFRLDNRDVLLKDGKYYFVSWETGIPFQVNQSFVNDHFSNGLLFLFNDSIQILSLNGKELLSPMKVEDAILKTNLLNYLEPTQLSSQQPFIRYGYIYAVDADTVLWQLNNRHLIDDAKLHVATLHEWMKKETPKTNCSLTPIWVTKTLYSELVVGSCYEHKNKAKTADQRTYRNYFVTKKGLVPLKLSDLFVEGSNWMPRLDAILEQEIQDKQFFGPTCIDMPGAIEAFKSSFYLNEGFLFFEHPGKQSLIRVSLGEFEGMLKE